MRPICSRISSRLATASSSWCGVASRSSSIPCTFAGSATAIRKTSPSSSYGIATTRSSTRIGTVPAAVSSMDVVMKSTSGNPNCAARWRATPSLDAIPSVDEGESEGARLAGAVAGEGELVCGNELRSPEQVDEQIDRLGAAERRRAADAVGFCRRRRPQAREACLKVSHWQPVSRYSVAWHDER